MNQLHTHPKPEKLQIKYHHSADLEDTKDIKRNVSFVNKKSDFTSLQHDFRMKEEAALGDLQREFEIEYEQFLINIRQTS